MTTSALIPAGRRALLVEADTTTRELCRELLAAQGFVVDAVAGGVAAVTASRLHLPDLVLLDLQLPDVPGIEVVGWLRSNPALETVPVIALSANGRLDDKGHDRDGAAIDAVLRKPVSRAAFARTIREVLK